MLLVDLNYNFEFDWFVELSDNKLSDNWLSDNKHRALVAQLVEHRAVTREVVSSTPARPTLRVLK